MYSALYVVCVPLPVAEKRKIKECDSTQNHVFPKAVMPGLILYQFIGFMANHETEALGGVP